MYLGNNPKNTTGGIDWGKIAVPLFIIMLGLGLFYQFLVSGG